MPQFFSDEIMKRVAYVTRFAKCLGRYRWIPTSTWLKYGIACFFLFTFGGSFARGQSATIRRFPADEHDASLVRLRQGRLAEAQLGFETALHKARHVGDDVGIDAVPSIIRIGESLCLQGMIEEGLDQIESGLLSARRSRGWVDYLQPTVSPVKGLSNEVRGIQWYTSTRRSQPGLFTDTWPVAIGKSDLLVENEASRKTVVGELIRLDVLEVYLAQARGLWLRTRYLGETIAEYSISREILEAFPEPKADLPEPIRRAHQICRGLAMLGVGQESAGFELIERQLTVQSTWDHPLTGVALLALSERARRNDDRKVAFQLAAEASILFARYEQYEWMTNAAERIGTFGALQRRSETQRLLEELAAWLRPRSDLASAAAMSSLASFAADLDMTSDAETYAAQALRPITKGIEPAPRVQLIARFVQSRVLLQKGRLDEGLAALERVLADARSFNDIGSLSRYLIQLNRLVRFHDQELLTQEAFSKQMNRLLDGPSTSDWQDQPLESLTATTTDLESYAAAWNQPFLQEAPTLNSLLALDRLQRLRQRHRLPLAARDLDLRLLLHASSSLLNVIPNERIASLRKALPTLDQASNAIQTTIAKASSISAIDSKDWSADDKKTWSLLVKQCDEQEIRIAEACTRRQFIPQVFPLPLSEELLATSKENLLGFIEVSGSLIGYSRINGVLERWKVERPDEGFVVYQQLIVDLGVELAPQLRSSLLLSSNWKLNANRLRKVLIPDQVWKSISNASQLTIIPDSWLWYVPFEAFPVLDTPRSEPLITVCSIQYAPTLSLVPSLRRTPAIDVARKAQQASDPPRVLFVNDPDFFTNDEVVNKSISAELTQLSETTKRISLDSKIQVSRWTKIQFDRAIVGVSTALQFGEPFAPLAYDSSSGTNLRLWLRLPMLSPREMSLIGNDMPTGRTSDAAGIEVGRLAFCMAASGNRTLLVSRWPSRGESAAILVKSFFEQLSDRPSDQAWQRAVLSLRETPLQENLEPSLIGDRRNRDSFLEDLTGQHPIFWANMMLIQN